MFDHRVENRQEFSHASHQSDLWGFPCDAQSFVKRTDHHITSTGDQSCHIEHGSHGGSAAPDRPTPFECAAVAIQRGNADQGGDLLWIEQPEFWELRQKGPADDRTDAGNTFKQVSALLPERALTDGLIKILVGTLEVGLKPAQVSLDPFAYHFGSAAQTISLGHNHLGDLASASNQGAQFQSHLIGQWAYGRTDRFGEASPTPRHRSYRSWPADR